jgi:hypothetical protein
MMRSHRSSFCGEAAPFGQDLPSRHNHDQEEVTMKTQIAGSEMKAWTNKQWRSMAPATYDPKKIAMKSKMMSLVAVTIIAFLALALPAIAQDCASQGGIVVHPGQGVQLSQVSYSFQQVLANVGLQPSSTGEVDINVPQLTTIMSSGFINVVSDAGWVVPNLPILPGFYDTYGYANISTTLNLNVSIGTTVSSLNATVCYTPQPLTQISSDSLETFAVGSTQHNGEGLGGVGTAEIPAPPPIGFAFPGGLFRFWLQFGHQNVQTALNQCAPASVANNFTWLKKVYGTPIPDQNILGLRGNPANSLVANLDLSMNSVKNWNTCGTSNVGREAASRVKGQAVPALSQLQGSMQYLAANNIFNLTLKHQGFSPYACDGFTGGAAYAWAGLNSAGQGVKVDPDFIFDELYSGSAVEYDAVRYSRAGVPAGGHAMDMIGAGNVLGVPFIFYVSDHDQLDDDDGTQYVDFSLLLPSNNTPNQQPQIVFGDMGGAVAVAVITQHP